MMFFGSFKALLLIFLFLQSSTCFKFNKRGNGWENYPPLSNPSLTYRLFSSTGILKVLVSSLAFVACEARAVDFLAPDGSFTFKYPDELKISEKMLGITMKTHDYEVFLKSETTKGFSAGVTVT